MDVWCVQPATACKEVQTSLDLYTVLDTLPLEEGTTQKERERERDHNWLML
jgi:hypothetical protein